MDYKFFTVLYFTVFGTALWFAGCILPCCISALYKCSSCVLLTFIFAYFTLPFLKAKYFDRRVPPRNKAVLITGCDTGFGHHLAKRLDARGFHVFASCLFPDGDAAKSLKKNASNRLCILGLDVTKDESVKEALEYVKANLGDSELWAIVNNAGIFKGFEIPWSHLRYFSECYDVNTLGVVRVTKAFLPLLFRSKGRVVTVASIFGRISVPAHAAYTMSKFATVAFCDTLRQEVSPWGVKVITIEPEGFKTEIMNLEVLNSLLEKTVNEADENIKRDYGVKYFQAFKDQIAIFTDYFSSRIYKVVDSLEDAVSLEHPSYVYKPARNVFVIAVLFLCENSPKPLLDFVARFVKYLMGYPLPKAVENKE